MDHPPSPRLAILIDAENVAASCWPAAAAIAARFGTAILARAYVCHPPSPGWRGAAGVEIIDGRPADGPNAADFLMAMDAAAIATEGRVDGFVLMTADDGFAAVAHGLKSRGMSVTALIPFNGGAVPRRLVSMADVAVLVPLPAPAKPAATPAPPPPPPMDIPDELPADGWERRLLLVLARCDADENGWVPLSDLGAELSEARVVMPKGKLSEVVRSARGIEWRGAKGAL